MFETFTPVRGSLWKQRVNAGIGSLFLGSVALWAALLMFEIGWGMNPVAKAFAAAVAHETALSNN
ncbi:MAG TPA: hypothetical protein VHD55_02725 [Candidatus Paceibacterota bacterium]|nr:hypothetical protein [Candidatus Paceibacterota bacterium]